MAEMGAYTMKIRISFSFRFTLRMMVSNPILAGRQAGLEWGEQEL
jgi:hypothetical protein